VHGWWFAGERMGGEVGQVLPALGGWLDTLLAAATSRAAVSAMMSSITSCAEGTMSKPG